ncbi:hypothetical protein ACGFMK_36470 [Amycolatopsis sp. NPDC049252]|uniref:hypothetical protein n=1 Tax=Amycolatopsis sp. NPDC049252 TaxID=3363933 RepID=UPI00371B3B96
MVPGDRVMAGTRDWQDTEEVRHDLDLILVQLSSRQARLVRRLSAPGPHPVTRAEIDEIGAVNWLAEAFWFRHPLVRTSGGTAMIPEEARGLVAALLDSRPGAVPAA